MNTPENTSTHPRSPVTAIKSSAILATAMTIAACGGGGGNDADRSQVYSLTGAENQTVEQTVKGTVSSVKQVRGSGQVTVKTQGANGNSRVTLTIGELENEEQARFQIITESGSERIKNIINLAATNTSAAPVLAQARELASLTGPETILADDLTLANVALEVEYLAGLITASEQDQTRQAINEGLADLTSDLESQISTVTALIQAYGEGTTTETDLRTNVAQVTDSIASIGPAGETILDQFSTTLEQLTVVLPEQLNDTYPLVFNDSLDRFTRFGAEGLGEMNDDGTFTFRSDLDYLNSVFAFATPATTTQQNF